MRLGDGRSLIADDLATEVLFESLLGVLAGRHHPLLRRSRLQLADLMDERWALSPPDSLLGRAVGGMFRRRTQEHEHAASVRLHKPGKFRDGAQVVKVPERGGSFFFNKRPDERRQPGMERKGTNIRFARCAGLGSHGAYGPGEARRAAARLPSSSSPSVASHFLDRFPSD